MSQPIAHALRTKWRSTDIKLDTKYTFSMLVKNRKILAGLKSAGFRRPSPVQVLAVSPARTGRDMIVQSKSGTGKTCLFVITALENISLNNPEVQVLIITPTREIATQVQHVVLTIGKYFQDLNCEVFIGGFPTYEDIAKLRNCQIAVGTPGRLKHLIESENMNTHCIDLLILDEADCLLESSFVLDIQFIIGQLPESRQMLAVSATYKDTIISTFLEYMHNAKVIRVYDDELALKGVWQFFHVLENEEYEKTYKKKLKVMLNILDLISFAQCMVFSSSMSEVLLLCQDFQRHGHAVASISSQDHQEKRLLTIAELKESKIKILVTSDLTARGIDAEHVDLVFNMDPGYDMETYVHRVGRAGRYGSRGISITLVTKGLEVQKLLWFKIKGDFPVYPLPDPIPRDLKKYKPSSPELANALLAYNVKKSINSKTYQLVVKESRDCTKILDSTTEDMDNQNKENNLQDSLKMLTAPGVERDTVDARVPITNSSTENSKMSLDGDKLLKGDALEAEEKVIKNNCADSGTVQQNLSTGSSDVELVVVDELPGPYSSEEIEVHCNDHTYCKVPVEKGAMTPSKSNFTDLIENSKSNSLVAADAMQKSESVDTLQRGFETGNYIENISSEVSMPDEQNGFNSCIKDDILVCDNEESKSGTEYEIYNLSLSGQDEEKSVYFDNLGGIIREEEAPEVQNEAKALVQPVNFFYQAGGGDFSSDSFFDFSVQSIEEKNMTEPVIECRLSLNSETVTTVEDLKKDDLADGDATSPGALNVSSMLILGNGNHAICNSDLQHISLSTTKNAESEVLHTKEVDVQLVAAVSNEKMKETLSHAGAIKNKTSAEKLGAYKMMKKNKIKGKTSRPKQLTHNNIDSSLHSYMQLRLASNLNQNKKKPGIRKSNKKEIPCATIPSLKTDEKELEENSYSRSSPLHELFEERKNLKLGGKKEFSKGAITKQKQGIQSDRKINGESEVNKFVDEMHRGSKCQEMDYLSRNSNCFISEVHKGKKCVASSSKTYKKTDHSFDNDFHYDDHESANYCNLQSNHCCQKKTASSGLGHVHKTTDVYSHCHSKCGRNYHFSLAHKSDPVPQKCHRCHHSSTTRTSSSNMHHQYYNNRYASYESIPMPFPFPSFHRSHDEDFDYGYILHKALLLSLSQN